MTIKRFANFLMVKTSNRQLAHFFLNFLEKYVREEFWVFVNNINNSFLKYQFENRWFIYGFSYTLIYKLFDVIFSSTRRSRVERKMLSFPRPQKHFSLISNFFYLPDLFDMAKMGRKIEENCEKWTQSLQQSKHHVENITSRVRSKKNADRLVEYVDTEKLNNF